VDSIVMGALRQLKDIEGLDRDEAYLLARLEKASPNTKAALLQAIEEAPE
jgi:hypothetical protein